MNEQFDKRSSLAKLSSLLGLSEEEVERLLQEQLPAGIPAPTGTLQRKNIPLFQCKIIGADKDSYSVFVPSTGWMGVLRSKSRLEVGQTVECRYLGKEEDKHRFYFSPRKSSTNQLNDFTKFKF